jgi:flagellar protein FliO/FliZ
MQSDTGNYKNAIAGMIIILLANFSVAADERVDQDVVAPISSSLSDSADAIAVTNDTPQVLSENPVDIIAPSVSVTGLGKPVKTPVVAPKINTGAHLMSLVFGLTLILLLIFALAWLVRRMGQGGLLSHSQMKIVAAMPLGTRERVVVVDVAGQQLLLGITTTQINTLHVFPEPVINTAHASSQSEFGKKLMAILQKPTESPSQTELHP